MHVPSSAFLVLVLSVWTVIPSSTCEAARYETSGEARAAVESFKQQIVQEQQKEVQVQAQIRELIAEMTAFKQRGPNVAVIDQQIAKVDNAIWLLKGQERTALDEVEHGLFCSDCKRSKTQIELEDRETFEQHIAEGSAHGRHATTSPELIAEAKRKTKQAFEAKIAPLQAELDSLRHERNQIVQAFNNSLAQMQLRINQAGAELARVEQEDQNARFQMNYASAMVSNLEQVEQWKAQQEKHLAMEKARREKEEAERQLRDAARRQREAEEQARKAKDAAARAAEQAAQRLAESREMARRAREAADGRAVDDSRRRAEQEAAALTAAAEAARLRALNDQQAAQAAEAERQEQLADLQHARDQLTQREQDSSPGPDAIAPAADTSPYQRTLDETRDKLSEIRQQISDRASVYASAVNPETAGPAPSAIDSLASLGQTSSLDSVDANVIGLNLWQAVSDAYHQLRQGPAESKQEVNQSHLEQMADALLNRALNYGPPTPAEQLESSIKSAFNVLLPDPGNAAGGMLQIAKEKAVDYLTTKATETATRSYIEQANRVLGTASAPDSSLPAGVAAAQQEFERSVSPANLWLQTGGFSLRGLKKYEEQVVDSFSNYFFHTATDIQSDPN